MKDYYSKTFFENQIHNSLLTAREVVPLVLKLIPIKNVVDVGCGIGTWLSVFKEHGIPGILGIDGEWVDKNMLMIPFENFLTCDLTKSIEIEKRFDLVVSLEVAEHLYEEYAETFVDSLTKLGHVILFSAAIPLQGGKHHVNEQWPEYWSALFQKKGYETVDCLRKNVWDNEKVGCWYAQNMLLYVKKDILSKNEILRKEFIDTNIPMLSVVHPKMFVSAMERFNDLKKDYDLIRKILFPIWWMGKYFKKLFL